MLLYLLSAVAGAIVALAVYILVHKASVKGRGEAIIQKAELEAEQIKQQKILQAKEKFLQLKSEHEDYISNKNKQFVFVTGRFADTYNGSAAVVFDGFCCIAVGDTTIVKENLWNASLIEFILGHDDAWIEFHFRSISFVLMSI
jgi:hypothetical protein